MWPLRFVRLLLAAAVVAVEVVLDAHPGGHRHRLLVDGGRFPGRSVLLQAVENQPHTFLLLLLGEERAVAKERPIHVPCAEVEVSGLAVLVHLDHAIQIALHRLPCVFPGGCFLEVEVHGDIGLQRQRPARISGLFGLCGFALTVEISDDRFRVLLFGDGGLLHDLAGGVVVGGAGESFAVGRGGVGGAERTVRIEEPRLDEFAVLVQLGIGLPAILIDVVQAVIHQLAVVYMRHLPGENELVRLAVVAREGERIVLPMQHDILRAGV